MCCHGSRAWACGACSAACGCVQCSTMAMEHRTTNTTSPPLCRWPNSEKPPLCSAALAVLAPVKRVKKSRGQCHSTACSALHLVCACSAEEDMCLQLRACVCAVRLFWSTYSFFVQQREKQTHQKFVYFSLKKTTIKDAVLLLCAVVHLHVQ